MSTAAIEKTIQDYLNAIEQHYGPDIRDQTVVKHLGSSTFLLKKHDVQHARTVDMDDLQLMTRHLAAR